MPKQQQKICIEKQINKHNKYKYNPTVTKEPIFLLLYCEMCNQGQIITFAFLLVLSALLCSQATTNIA